jgi:hypothetical protein
VTGVGDLIEALRRLLRHKTAWAVGVMAVMLEAALFWWWLSLPMGTTVQVASIALVAAVMLGGAAALIWQGSTLFTNRARPYPWWKTGAFWIAILAAIVVGGYLPWLLLHWVLPFPQMELQAVSFGIRALISDVLVCGAALWVSAVVAVIREVHGTDI